MKEVLISSSVLILALTGLRYLFRKQISRRLQYALWGLVLLRLLLPVPMPAARFSVMTGAGRLTGPMEAVYPLSPVPDPPYGDFTAFPAPAPSEPVLSEQPLTLPDVLRLVWLGGAALALGLFAASNLRFSRRLRRDRTAFDAPDFPLPVYVSEGVVSPCLFGLLRPAVYLTPKAAGQSPEQLRHVLTHELCHYRHGDHIWSVLRCLVLAVYWFDPLVWLAAVLSRVDAEEACDESALRILGDGERLSYGRTLVDMVAVRAVPSGMLCAATTMTSGKRGIKRRLERIIQNPRPLVWALAVTLLLAAALVGCTFTGAEQDSTPAEETPAVASETAGPLPVPPSEAPEAQPVPSDYTVTLLKNGTEVSVTGFDPSLPEDIVFDAMIKSAAWPAGELGERPYRFLIRRRADAGETSEPGEHYAFRLDDGRAVLQSGGMYTFLNEALMVQLEEAAGIEPGQVYDLEAAVTKAILENETGYLGEYLTESHVVLSTVVEDRSDGSTVTVYCMVLSAAFDCTEGRLEVGSGSSGPAAITFDEDLDGAYRLTEYWIPMDGTYYESSIRKKFPADIAEQAMDTQTHILALEQSCFAQAIAHYGLDVSGEVAEMIDLLASYDERPDVRLPEGFEYMDAYQRLHFYGDETLRCIFGEYLKGGQSGRRDEIMHAFLSGLLGGENIGVEAESGQDYFDQWKEHVLRLYEQNDLDYFREHAPKSYLLLDVMGLTRPQVMDVPAPAG